MANPGYARRSALALAFLTMSGCASVTGTPFIDRMEADATPVVRAAAPDETVTPPAPVTIPPVVDQPELIPGNRLPESSSDRWAVTWDRLGRDIDLSLEDYQNYYSWGNLAALGLGIGAVAPIANTTADEHIRHWYQNHVRGETTGEFSQIFEYTGQLWLVVPLYVEGAALLGHGGDDYAFDGGLSEWSNRSLRAVAVGSPPMVALYVILGSGRPDRSDSHWHPFNDSHGVSGHTFFGAVPFLTAAEMTDNEVLKASLVAGSFLTGWARINDDRHYFSQVALGWWMAYLAVRSVDRTQAAHPSYELLPCCSEGPGIGIQFRY